MKTLVNKLDAVLPQTQCGQCRYAGCYPYAEALATGSATIDRCPPGGITTVIALAQLLQQDAQPFLTAIKKQVAPFTIAAIDEAVCIGCTKCIQACPVDAIVGAAKQLHTVLKDECTGCQLCISPCPVNCIHLVTVPVLTYQPDKARQRFRAKQARHQQKSAEPKQPNQPEALTARRAYISNAVARFHSKQSKL